MNEDMMSPGGMPPQIIQEQRNKNYFDMPNADTMGGGGTLQLLREYTKVDLQKYPSYKKIISHFAGFINSVGNITFYEDAIKERQYYESDFRRAYLNFMMQLEPGEFDQDMRTLILNIKRYSDMVFNRSVGMRQGKINERTLQATNIHQNINSSAGNRAPSQSFGNFLNRIF